MKPYANYTLLPVCATCFSVANVLFQPQSMDQRLYFSISKYWQLTQRINFLAIYRTLHRKPSTLNRFRILLQNYEIASLKGISNFALLRARLTRKKIYLLHRNLKGFNAKHNSIVNHEAQMLKLCHVYRPLWQFLVLCLFSHL